MRESLLNTLDRTVTVKLGEPPNTAEIAVKLRTWLVFLMSMWKPSIKKHYDWQNGCFKPSEMLEATDEYLLYFIGKIAREHSLPCDLTTGWSSTKPTKDAEKQNE